jgi:hypothetical protein
VQNLFSEAKGCTEILITHICGVLPAEKNENVKYVPNIDY